MKRSRRKNLIVSDPFSQSINLIKNNFQITKILNKILNNLHRYNNKRVKKIISITLSLLLGTPAFTCPVREQF